MRREFQHAHPEPYRMYLLQTADKIFVDELNQFVTKFDTFAQQTNEDSTSHQEHVQQLESFGRSIDNLIGMKEVAQFVRKISGEILRVLAVLLEKYAFSVVRNKGDHKEAILAQSLNCCTTCLRRIQFVIHRTETGKEMLKSDMKLESGYSPLEKIVKCIFYILKNPYFWRDTVEFCGLVICDLLSEKSEDELVQFYMKSCFEENSTMVDNDDELYKKVILKTDAITMSKQFCQFSTMGKCSFYQGILNIHNPTMYTRVVNGYDQFNIVNFLVARCFMMH
jgi:hypothetical protein